MGYSRMARRMGEWLMCFSKICNASQDEEVKVRACRNEAEMASGE